MLATNAKTFAEKKVNLIQRMNEAVVAETKLVGTLKMCHSALQDQAVNPEQALYDIRNTHPFRHIF